jgi:thiamine biosynthesis protein ThiS
VNGRRREVEDGTSVETLLDTLAAPKDRLAVEVNGRVVPRSARATTRLRDGDRIEIVTFVGGG